MRHKLMVDFEVEFGSWSVESSSCFLIKAQFFLTKKKKKLKLNFSLGPISKKLEARLTYSIHYLFFSGQETFLFFFFFFFF
jgi:hypothetical protein